MSEQGPSDDQRWQRELIERLSMASLQEQRRARRWSIFFKLLLFGYLFTLLYLAVNPLNLKGVEELGGRHTAVIDLQGAIGVDSDASADNLVTALRDAFEDENTAGVVLRINSPGGSPVQSDYVYHEIRRLREKYPETPIYAVVQDLCASGGYYIASATDKIYANPASLVGSIGVLMNGFGFVDTLDKLGIERRLYTAGESKGFLDPFTPAKAQDIAHVQGLLAGIHQQFIEAVKQGRGERLKEDPSLFTGLLWDGRQAKELGLIDDFASTSQVAREVIKEEKLVDFTVKKSEWEQFAERFGTAVGRGAVETLGLEPNLR